MIRAPFALTAILGLLALAISPALARSSVKIYTYSQEAGSESAQAGASISTQGSTPARTSVPTVSGAPSASGVPAAPGVQTASSSPVVSGGSGGSVAGAGLLAPEPTISSGAAKYRSARPFGTGSFWFARSGSQRCAYMPASNGVCFTVTTPAKGQPTGATGTVVSPAALAASLAAKMDLWAGSIAVSPSARTAGLAGAASWFWLAPAPQSRSLSISLSGESVTVTATPDAVRWAFGDGSVLLAGPGVPYSQGAVPPAAVRHVYQTRCLPGDQGHDPRVLASCGPDGYAVQALVRWSIGYTATGPVTGSGALPSRSTVTSIVYPVSEARAFLTAGTGR